MLRRAAVIRPDLVVLDAGCGCGLASLALLDELQKDGIHCRRLDAFDLTPAMLARFRDNLASRSGASVRIREADVMDPHALPAGWTGYDLVLSTSMLEYLPRQDLPVALAGLGQRMAPGGRIVIMMTRKTFEAGIVIGIPWRAERYDRSELRAAFRAAEFEPPRFIRFPLRYGWMNRANLVAVARRPDDAVGGHGTSNLNRGGRHADQNSRV